MREAQRTSHFPLRLSRTTVDVISILNIHVPRYQIQLANEKEPHAHNSQCVEQQTGPTGPVANANILSGVKSMRSKSASTAKPPCLAIINARWTSVL
jgi:hypothetical protein